MERIKSYLNPLDFLLWLSEELDSSDWEQWEKDCTSSSRIGDDVFGEVVRTSWFSWFASFVVHLLAYTSVLNAFYTFWRKRHYRLFEASIDTAPATPSAHRVPVNSSPMVSPPLRVLSKMMSTGSAEARAHPSAEQDVWEIGMWDPRPLSLRLFCLFSPGHVMIYCLFLPTSPADPRPSVTIVTTLFLALLLTVQMSMLSASFAQQAKDSRLVHKEVLNEYDTKFVRPRTHPIMRSVATQHSEEMSYNPNLDEAYNTVKYGLIRLINEEEDLCTEITNVDLSCPLEKGPMNVSKEVLLPKEIPPGTYTVYADANTEEKERITCLKAEAMVSPTACFVLPISPMQRISIMSSQTARYGPCSTKTPAGVIHASPQPKGY
ncbi:uncharacterized protein PADG_03176 [Paracoccidioides brasiliensis Pb18]|uniref:Phosphatidylglycerol/phosphatidylinositol transfer protein n=1 Tax=Paracoccidioides brasiliensis (strain Pb18) TaxID=502780 RepID=C1G7M1_PARBD|nr:uncharacterized protein PADG_03176 [Paracoccidioides brasiliensis Pb18]EEH47078.2 hypothetical protein PADG_03176 [Paracoccidioides brasiliensis Pb18]